MTGFSSFPRDRVYSAEKVERESIPRFFRRLEQLVDIHVIILNLDAVAARLEEDTCSSVVAA